MRNKFMAAFAATAFMLALSFPLATPASPRANSATPQAQKGERAEHEGREAHPEIRQAIRALEHTKMTLQKKSASDFGGHKAKAVQEINEALGDLHEALAYDKK